MSEEIDGENYSLGRLKIESFAFNSNPELFPDKLCLAIHHILKDQLDLQNPYFSCLLSCLTYLHNSDWMVSSPIQKLIVLSTIKKIINNDPLFCEFFAKRIEMKEFLESYHLLLNQVKENRDLN